jgi:hypothetical protein
MKATSNGLPNFALPLESKKRLNDFRRQLASNCDRIQFDDQVLKVIEKYAYQPGYVHEVRKYLNELKDPEGFPFSRSLKSSVQLDKAIHAFEDSDYTSFRWNSNYQEALLKVKREFSMYHLVPLSFSCDDDIINAIPKLDTHSGWTFILSGNRKKGENLDDIYSTWLAEVNKARKVGSLNKPILPGTRTQGSGEFTDQGDFTFTCKHKTRLVSMMDLIEIISELVFAKPFQDLIGWKPFYAGGKSVSQIGSIISNLRAKYSEYVSLDYSAYDQSISSWLIEDAFDIIKSAFRELTCEEQELWDVVVHDFIHKTFITKDGCVVSHKGVPSGSMFTQIIDSIVNRVMIETYLLSQNIRGEMIIMGDDNLLYYTCPTNNHDIRDEVATYLTKNFGVKCNNDKSSYGTRYQYPEFLSRQWRDNGVWRHPRILISKMLFSERFRKYDEQSTPELVVYSYVLAYGLGMQDFFDVNRFLLDTGFNPSMLNKLDSKNLPGIYRVLSNHAQWLSVIAA